ncbi:beta-lactamase-like protein [Dactylonectria macrodidyma]|uniref:Beta-lactamase-like protein n=1 Tax=Dactylonectria macrodidyma TaxID=307937 RepID=A0A9P9E373_9HYPO|nr:beta-lactamase-like protein [Dactylonectria macrodidyma]
MCQIHAPWRSSGAARNPPAEPGTSFAASRLNSTTFLVIEEDEWDENPFIYIKTYPQTLVIIDTGGGIARNPDAELSSLKKFLETYSLAVNDNQPLNPGGFKTYTVICSHCHFDHIGGVPQFAADHKTAVWASGYDREFIEGPGRLPTTSLCRYVGMQTPQYKVTHWASDGHNVTDSAGEDLGLVIYQTPGHTPDELAVWDPQERFLFAGDTIYEWYPILFPPEGDLVLYSETLAKLRSLVDIWNKVAESSAETFSRRVKLACGHLTKDGDAEKLLADADSFLYRITQELVEPRDAGEDKYGLTEPREGGTPGGDQLEIYGDEGAPISFMGPKVQFKRLRESATTVAAFRERCL